MKFSPAIFTSPFVLLAMLLGLVIVGEAALVMQLDRSITTPETDSDVTSPLPQDTLHSFTRDAAQANEWFGAAVASGESLALIGSPRQHIDGRDTGAAYLFERGPRGEWRTTHTFVRSELPAGAMFGSALAMNDDRLLIGVCPNETKPAHAPVAYAYQRSADQWASTALYMDDDTPCLVHSVSLALDGDTAIIGQVARLESGRLANQVCIFRSLPDGTWKRIAKLDPGDTAASLSGNFGAAVAISRKRVLVGAPLQRTTSGNTGAAYVYEESDDGLWHRTAMLTASDGQAADCFGASVALTGDTALIGAMGAEASVMNSGQAYVFRSSDNGRWTQTAKLSPDDLSAWSGFGNSVALANNLAVVGAPGVGDGTGTVYVFRIDSNGISQLARHTPTDATPRSGFGHTVSAAGNTILAGAPWADSANLDNSGAAYAIQIPSSTAFRKADLRHVALALFQE